MQEVLSVVTVGHVDHGKSTVIGRLLADSGALPKGKLEQVRESCKRNAKPFEYAFLLDALKTEQAQGITIDTARCFLKTDKRGYMIIDAPGHIEFLKNMVTGASRAQAALLVIDAARGVEENTRRHGYFLAMLGIGQVAVIVNKMDLVGYSNSVFLSIKDEYERFLKKINITPAAFIPASGSAGDNITVLSPHMPWYDGPSVIGQLDGFTSTGAPENQPLRLPVQGVYKFTGHGDDRRIIAGAVETGGLKAGDAVVFWPSGKKTLVKTLEAFNAPMPGRFSAGQAAGFTMTEEIFVKRGEIACLQGQTQPCVGVRLRANLFWLGKKPFSPGRRYYLKCGTAKVEMHLERVERVINAADLSCAQRRYAERNEVAECVIGLEHPIAFDLAGDIDATSRFVIVDGYEIAGGGIITQSLSDIDYDGRNIRWSAGAVTMRERKKYTSGKGLVLWMTGLSGSGKTTIAQETERILVESGIPAYILDGDTLRRGLNADLGFSDADRIENMRRTAEVAKLFRDAGVVTIVTLISPFAESRNFARRTIGDGFVEVYIKASIEACIERDPKNLYKKALEGRIKNFTGIDSPYEPPERAELVLDTEGMSELESVNTLAGFILDALKASDEE